ncbi:hypothetical protein [Lacticaseibacillus porcinae]|uniref:hypothetical protein n=1 Tax=Lacticaseibacillus porcinae TaxID=1123687 RepID=UPI0013DE0016|nr:hypothetical protein [Lacticaseibacillus porcinae]
MRKLIAKFGFRKVLIATVSMIVVLTIALAGSGTMAVKRQHQLDSWVTYTLN